MPHTFQFLLKHLKLRGGGRGTATSVTEFMLVDSSSKDVGLATPSEEQQAVNSSVELTGKCLG